MKKEETPPRSLAPGPRPRCCQREPQGSASQGLSGAAGVGFPPPFPLFPSAGDWPRPVKVRKGTGEKGTQRPPSPTSPQ